MSAKRKLRSAFLFILATIAFAGCIALTACSGQDDNSTEQNSSVSNTQSVSGSEKDDNGMKHYEIELDTQNFSKFIKYTVTETLANADNKTGNHYKFQGVLSFAYYKNITLTLSATYEAPSWQGGEQTTFQFSVVLNAAGDFEFDTNNPIALEKLGWASYKPGTKSQIEVVGVSGKVIFNV